jgi:hypothetical protein
MSDETYAEIEEFWDKMPIADQLACFDDQIENTKASVLSAFQIGQRLAVAAQAGILSPAEEKRFADTILGGIRDLKAMLAEWYPTVPSTPRPEQG